MIIGHQLFGHGPVRAIVVHGWFYDARVFEPMLPGLDPEAFTLALMDCRGYGLSKERQGPFTMETVAKDALALASHLRWDRFCVVGHSMGGKAALRIATFQPKRVIRILALTPVWAARAQFDAKTKKLFHDAVLDIDVRAAILGNEGKGMITEAWARWMASRSAENSTTQAFEGYLDSWSGDDFSEEVRQLRHEILAVVGDSDVGVPAAMVEATWLANLPNARMEVLRGCGHYPMVEQPLALACTVERFLAGDHTSKVFT